ncbi:MAG: hypothetical protein MJ239_00135 [Bacilli bacterium]|nr:hypothetical protein [Bacilli bacterium]
MKKPQLYGGLTDEELIILIWLGVEKAYEVLFNRYQQIYKWPDSFVSNLRTSVDITDLQFIFISSFSTIVPNYDLLKGYFRAYFRSCIAQDIYKEAKKIVFPHGEKHALSLDALNAEGTCLYDCVSDDDYMNDPRAYLEYFDTLKSLNKLPKSLNKRTSELVSLIVDGYTIIEASKKLDIPYRTAKEMLSKFKKWAETVVTYEK